MDTTSDGEKTGSDLNKDKREKLILSTTFINGEKIFECSSGIASVDNIKDGNEHVEIFMNSNNLSDHIKSVMSHVNDNFTKKINEIKAK
ncbi:conserved Plasmodium protein, unknown function [Plasmodium malariae]|uniref:Uncharacterized protein n=1 Tax=Plasmodium malariae TaxID=5858 RepID=A0A1C3KZ17_PLAMA|nr:conserved Plasmodium protein, unknown function [Plasmodium malariae]